MITLSPPLAVDYQFPLTVEHRSLPIPELPSGWARLNTQDYTHLSELHPVTGEVLRHGVAVRLDQLAAEWRDAQPRPDDTEQRRASLLLALGAKRYEAEVSGFDYLGKRVMSDRDSQSKIQGLMVGVQLLGDSFHTNWKCEGGQWLNLDKNGALGLVAAALSHVSTLFDKEAELAMKIRTSTDLDATAAEVDMWNP